MDHTSTDDRPNILFIMTDQQRYDALGANGNPEIHTPNLDRIAASGVNLHGYYTNHPICGPSRATLFTGRYVHSHRVRGNAKPNYVRSDQELHMFRLLKNAGYSIGYVGKNHLLRDEEWQNFDHADVWGYNHPDFWGRLAEQLTPSQREYAELERECFRAFQSERGAYAGARFHDYPDEDTKLYAMRESALRFLRERDPERPFCLNLQIFEPHAPHIAPRRFREMYPPEEMKLPPTSENDMPGKPTRYGIKYRACRSDRVSDHDRRMFMSVYYSMVTYLDEQVGYLLEELERQGILEITLIIFTADHGDFCCHHGTVKKDTVLLDDLLHVPLLFSWPAKLEARDAREALVEEVDVLPTILDLLGLDTPFGVQGRSFAGVLTGRTGEHRDAVHAEASRPGQRNPFDSYEEWAADWAENHDEPHGINIPADYTKGIRTDRYRYNWFVTGEEELYDLENDPEEWHNLASSPEHRELKSDLKTRLFEWHVRTEDPLDQAAIERLQTEYPNWQT